MEEYNQILQKYLVHHQKNFQPKNQVSEQKSANEEYSADDIIESVPKTMQRKAQLLIKRLQQNPHIQWNRKGEMIFRDSPLPNSNVSDLINDLLRHRKNNTEPLGWQLLADHLSEMNVPQELIGNPKRLEYIKQKDVKPPGSPVTPPTKRRKRNRETPSMNKISLDKWSPFV